MQVFTEYMARDALKYSKAPSPFGDRGDTPRWGLMAGTAACYTQYIRCCPLFPVQSQSAELPAATEGESSGVGSSQGHKAGPLAVLLTSRHKALLQGGFKCPGTPGARSDRLRVKGAVAESNTVGPVTTHEKVRPGMRRCRATDPKTCGRQPQNKTSAGIFLTSTSAVTCRRSVRGL